MVERKKEQILAFVEVGHGDVWEWLVWVLQDGPGKRTRHLDRDTI